MARNKDYMRMINSARWLRLRKDTLTAHPLCHRCRERGVLTASCEVHHIQPVEEAFTLAEMQQRMFDPANLTALCHACHREVHVEMGQRSKAATKARNARQIAEACERLYGGGDSDGDSPPIF